LIGLPDTIVTFHEGQAALDEIDVETHGDVDETEV
jgi:hypothetical protein